MRTIRSYDRGFSIIEAMIAAIIMLIGLLGLASLQIVGVRANHLGKRMAQASLLANELAQNMQMWTYNDARLATVNHTAVIGDPNSSAVQAFWDVGKATAPSQTFDYTDGASGATRTGQLATGYQGVASPLEAGAPIFSRYWNVWSVDAQNPGTPTAATGKLVQIVVRWKEPAFGWRQVNTSFFRYDEGVFNQ